MGRVCVLGCGVVSAGYRYPSLFYPFREPSHPRAPPSSPPPPYQLLSSPPNTATTHHTHVLKPSGPSDGALPPDHASSSNGSCGSIHRCHQTPSHTSNTTATSPTTPKSTKNHYFSTTCTCRVYCTSSLFAFRTLGVPLCLCFPCQIFAADGRRPL